MNFLKLSLKSGAQVTKSTTKRDIANSRYFPQKLFLILSQGLKSTKECDTHSLRYFPKNPKSTSQPAIATHTHLKNCPYSQSKAQVNQINQQIRHNLTEIYFPKNPKTNIQPGNSDTHLNFFKAFLNNLEQKSTKSTPKCDITLLRYIF